MRIVPEASIDWLAEPDLFEASVARCADVPDDYRAWVYLQGSVTSAIAEKFDRSPGVVVHYSDDCTLLPWETQLITGGFPKRMDGFARHISLLVDSKAVLVARSAVLRDSAIRSSLTALQSTPLTTLLFETDNWQRSYGPLPLITEAGLIGRVCVWQDMRLSQAFVLEEFFLHPLIYPDSTSA